MLTLKIKNGTLVQSFDWDSMTLNICREENSSAGRFSRDKSLEDHPGAQFSK